MSDPENPTSDSPSTANALDLRFLPSWLKEENSAPVNYANFDGEDRAPRGDRGPRRDGGGGDRRGPRPSGGGRDNRGPQRSDAPGQRTNNGPAGGPRPPQAGGRPTENRGQRRPDSGRPGPQAQSGRRNGPPDRRQEQRPPQPEERPAKVNVTFIPEILALEKVTEQLKSAPIAYPLFGVAKMFLQRPERHLIQIKPHPEAQLFKLQNTAHLSTDRQRLESIAFQELWKQFFRVEVKEAPEIKGNFSSVARSRLTGKVFGPTSHHSYQPAIHKEYEERFSRRMSFQEYKSNIETTNNPEAIELWKTESRRQEVYHLLTAAEMAELSDVKEEPVAVAETAEPTADEVISETFTQETVEPDIENNAEPTIEDAPTLETTVETLETEIVETPADTTPASPTFASKAEAEAYFRKEILPTLITAVESETLTGHEARNLTDRRMATSMRLGWEAEMRYPLGLVNSIRVKFNEQNLHIFKFKKRVLLISSLKPSWLDDKSQSLSGSIRTVLQTIQANPGIDRKGLAEKILGNNVGATEDEKLSLKHSLIGDLYWLVRQGHVIEFSDGTFDLPMGPKAIQAEAAAEEKTNPNVAQHVDILPLAAVDASSAEPQEQ